MIVLSQTHKVKEESQIGRAQRSFFFLPQAHLFPNFLLGEPLGSIFTESKSSKPHVLEDLSIHRFEALFMQRNEMKTWVPTT